MSQTTSWSYPLWRALLLLLLCQTYAVVYGHPGNEGLNERAASDCHAACAATVKEPLIVSWAYQSPAPFVKSPAESGSYSITIYETVTLVVDEAASTSSLVTAPSVTCLNTYGGPLETATATLSLLPGVTTTIVYPTQLTVFTDDFYQWSGVLPTGQGNASVCSTAAPAGNIVPLPSPAAGFGAYPSGELDVVGSCFVPVYTTANLGPVFFASAFPSEAALQPSICGQSNVVARNVADVNAAAEPQPAVLPRAPQGPAPFSNSTTVSTLSSSVTSTSTSISTATDTSVTIVPTSTSTSASTVTSVLTSSTIPGTATTITQISSVAETSATTSASTSESPASANPPTIITTSEPVIVSLQTTPPSSFTTDVLMTVGVIVQTTTSTIQSTTTSATTSVVANQVTVLSNSIPAKLPSISTETETSTVTGGGQASTNTATNIVQIFPGSTSTSTSILTQITLSPTLSGAGSTSSSASSLSVSSLSALSVPLTTSQVVVTTSFTAISGVTNHLTITATHTVGSNGTGNASVTAGPSTSIEASNEAGKLGVEALSLVVMMAVAVLL